MIKLYDLVFEQKKLIKRQPNFATDNLGDKNEEFEEKLALMPPEASNELIKIVNRLKGSQLEEFKNLLNKYPNVKDLKGVKTPLERKIAALQPGTAGPGEILFHLELEDSEMDVGDKTNHDLIVKGKIWEVKKVDGIEKGVRGDLQPVTNIRLAKKGRASKFKFNTDLLKTVILLDKIIANSKLEDDLSDISPRLQSALDMWGDKMIGPNSNTPKEAILQGDHNQKFMKIMINLINIIKSEIEINTDDEYTNVRFGGVGVVPKEKGIDPVSIQSIDDESVTLNFIGKDTLRAIEILNDLPYAQEADFENDFEAAVFEALEDMPSTIVWGGDGRLLVIEKEKFKDYFEFGGVSQGDLQVRIKYDVWRKA